MKFDDHGKFVGQRKYNSSFVLHVWVTLFCIGACSCPYKKKPAMKHLVVLLLVAAAAMYYHQRTQQAASAACGGDAATNNQQPPAQQQQQQPPRCITTPQRCMQMVTAFNQQHGRKAGGLQTGAGFHHYGVPNVDDHKRFVESVVVGHCLVGLL